MSKKRKAKIKLPTDRHGTPIHIGDVMLFDGGETIKVESLTYFDNWFDSLGYCWVANDDDSEKYSDNLGAGEIIWKSK